MADIDIPRFRIISFVLWEIVVRQIAPGDVTDFPFRMRLRIDSTYFHAK